MRVDEVVAVAKTSDFSSNGMPYSNKIELLSTRLMTEKLIGLTGQQGAELLVLQKFVRSKGPYAFVCRAVYRRNKTSYTWVITNKMKYKEQSDKIPYFERYVTKINNPMHCTIVKSKGDSQY